MRWLCLLMIFAAVSACGDDERPTEGRDAGRDAGSPIDGSSLDAGPITRPSRGCPSDIASHPDVMQQLPRIGDFDTAYPETTGRTIAVGAGGDLQAAIDMAQPGDVIELDPSGTYTGPFTLTEKTGEGWIVIRTATPDAMLPPEGTRVRPIHAPLLPDLVVGAGTGGVFQTAPRAHHWRLTGLEIAPASGEFVNALIELGGGESAVADMPHHLVIDRVYMHAEPDQGTRRAIALNSGAAAVVDSWLEGFFHVGYDSQAIGGWSGTGPYRIINNRLEGASENLMFGGADPAIADVVPSDIEVCGNHFDKPMEWLGMSRNVKNLFELKNARRVLVAGNVFERNWADGQVGFAIVLTPRNQDGTAPWSTIEDVTFVRNVVRRTAGGINILGTDDIHPSGQQQRVVIEHNLIEIDVETYPGTGRALQIITPSEPTLGLRIAHNTIRVGAGNSAVTMGDGGPVAMMASFVDNVADHGMYGIFGGGRGEGNAAIMHYLPDAVVRRNVLIGYDMSSYPPDNFFPTTEAELPTFAGMATDGTDPGADMTALEAATAGVVVDP